MSINPFFISHVHALLEPIFHTLYPPTTTIKAIKSPITSAAMHEDIKPILRPNKQIPLVRLWESSPTSPPDSPSRSSLVPQPCIRTCTQVDRSTNALSRTSRPHWHWKPISPSFLLHLFLPRNKTQLGKTFALQNLGRKWAREWWHRENGWSECEQPAMASI